MDDRYVFDRFHEALELEPNAGAYERFRSTFINLPDATKKRPVFRLRFSKMGFRLAAAVAVVAIAIALVAGFLAIHHPTAGVPAHHVDKNTLAYQALMNKDYNVMNASTSQHCQTIADAGCAAAIAPVNAALQKWIADLAAFGTPPAYAALDSMIRAHLQIVIDAQNAAIQLQKQHNEAGFTLAMNTAFYERSWIDPAAFTVEDRYAPVAGSYQSAVQSAQRSIDGCVGTSPGPADRACNVLINGYPCFGIQAATCEGDVEVALTQVESYVISVVQNPAPAKVAAKTVAFESDLAKADEDLLSISEAMVAGDSTKATAAENSFSFDIQLVQGDVAVLVAGS